MLSGAHRSFSAREMVLNAGRGSRGSPWQPSESFFSSSVGPEGVL